MKRNTIGLVVFLIVIAMGVLFGEIGCPEKSEGQEKKLSFPPRKTVFDPPGLSQEEYEYIQKRRQIAIDYQKDAEKERIKVDSLLKAMYNRIQFKYETDLEFIGINVLKLLQEYSAECYADSFAMSGEVFLDWETAKLDTVYPPSKLPAMLIGSTGEIVRKYFHKQPTFPGFMKFLEGKHEAKK